MIIRPLRDDEKYKSDILMGLSFNYPVDVEQLKKEKLSSTCYGAFEDDGNTLMAQMYLEKYEVSYCGKYLPCTGYAGAATAVEARKKGALGAIFKTTLPLIKEPLAFLYPMSFMYYERFGFVDVVDFKGIRYPLSLITEPAWNNAVLYDNENMLPVLLSLYDRFAMKNNLEFRRCAGEYYNPDPYAGAKKTYIIRDESNEPCAYVTLTVERNTVKITELIYDDTPALKKVIGFVSLFAGQVDSAEFFGVTNESPIEILLREKTKQETNCYHSVMGRVTNAETILNANAYPDTEGCFRIKLTDSLIDSNNAVFSVKYAGGNAEVTKTDGNYDISLDIHDFSLIVLSGRGLRRDALDALASAEIVNEEGTESFLSAFPSRNTIMHNHF